MGNYQRRLTRNLTQGRRAGVRFQGDGGSNGWNMGDWQHKSILEEEIRIYNRAARSIAEQGYYKR